MRDVEPADREVCFQQEKRSPGPAEITCQVLPPDSPGYRTYGPFTLDPGLAEAWTAPDRATAARLVKESGTRRMTVTVWSYAGFSDVSGYFVRLLDSLGYHARLRTLGDDSQGGFDTFYGHLADSHNRAQMGAFWINGFPSPADPTSGLRCHAFVPNDRNNQNISEFCSRKVGRGTTMPLACRPPTNGHSRPPATGVPGTAGHPAAGGRCSRADPRPGPADQSPSPCRRSIGGTHVQVEARTGPGARGPAGGHQPGRHDRRRRPRPDDPAATHQGQVGEAWHPRVSPPAPRAGANGQPRWPVTSLAVLAAALALSGGLAARQASRRARPGLAA